MEQDIRDLVAAISAQTKGTLDAYKGNKKRFLRELLDRIDLEFERLSKESK